MWQRSPPGKTPQKLSYSPYAGLPTFLKGMYRARAMSEIARPARGSEGRHSVKGAWIDRRREGWDVENDAAFLERVDMLVMAEWDRRRQGGNLRQLAADYAVRAEFLLLLQDLLMVRGATGGLAPLPSRSELALLLTAVREARGEERVEDPELIPADDLGEEWDLPINVTTDTAPSTCR